MGLFDEKGGRVESVNHLASVQQQIEDYYDNFTQTAYKLNEGDFEKAESFLDTDVNMFYYRLSQKIKYNQWFGEKTKEATKPKK